MPQALDALRRLFALGANRRFSSTSLGRSVQRAIVAANRQRAEEGLPLIPDDLTVYALTRHTFGTEIFRASKNLKAVQDLLGHSDINQSARYALAAVTEHTAEAIRQTAAAQTPPTPETPAPAVGGKVDEENGKVSPAKTARAVRTRRT